jgi:hypothetical protein
VYKVNKTYKSFYIHIVTEEVANFGSFTGRTSESGNRLDRAFAIGRHDYIQTEKDDQELAECCKRILKNVVVCWNFMYVSQKLARAVNPIQRSAILQKVRVSSLLAWEHFILHGEFDFSDARLQDSQKFDFDSMMDPKIVDEGE